MAQLKDEAVRRYLDMAKKHMHPPLTSGEVAQLLHAWLEHHAKPLPLKDGADHIRDATKMVMVPVEPTEAMLDKGAKMFEATLHSAADFKHHAFHVFSAMIAAFGEEA